MVMIMHYVKNLAKTLNAKVFGFLVATMFLLNLEAVEIQTDFYEAKDLPDYYQDGSPLKIIIRSSKLKTGQIIQLLFLKAD